MLYERDYHLGLTETEEQQYEEITGRKFWGKEGKWIRKSQ